MILIISEETERTTDEVIQWLLCNKIDFLRINKEDDFKIIMISPNNGQLLVETKGTIYDIAKFDAVWYRRGFFNSNIIKSAIAELSTDQNKMAQINRFLFNEWNVLNNFLFYLIESKKRVLGNYSKSIVNKLINLHIAKDCGLLIPETIISSKGNVLSRAIGKNDLISKPISESETFNTYDGSIFKMFTEVVGAKDVNESSKFFPSLIQFNIEKWIELRIFFIEKRFYAMAIFSQSSQRTTVDYRNYNNENPNRIVPFILPKIIERKLCKYTNRLGLNTGSIDMIVTKKKDFVFLEVNPVGNIEMVSKTCNYPIERDIANYLSNER